MATHLSLLLLVLLGLLLGLRLLNSSSSRRKTLRRALVSSCGNGGKVSTNDSTLVLDGLPRPLLGNLLRDTLLVHAAVHYRPSDLTGVLALQEKRFILGGREPEDLKWEVLISRMITRNVHSLRTLLSPRTKRRPLLG